MGTRHIFFCAGEVAERCAQKKVKKMATITVGGSQTYQYIVDVLNNLFGCQYQRYGRGSWRTLRGNPDTWVMFPHFKYEDEVNKAQLRTTGLPPDTDPWFNVMDRKQTWLEELSKPQNYNWALANRIHRRIVFANHLGEIGYKFVGCLKAEARDDFGTLWDL